MLALDRSAKFLGTIARHVLPRPAFRLIIVAGFVLFVVYAGEDRDPATTGVGALLMCLALLSTVLDRPH